MSWSDDSQLMNYVVRMVTPMRREFGRTLDVQHFLHDFEYAREVVDLALKSSDERLVDYARYVRQRLHGPRIADTPQAAAPTANAPQAAEPRKPDTPQADAIAPGHPKAAEALRNQVLKKYTGGLR